MFYFLSTEFVCLVCLFYLTSVVDLGVKNQLSIYVCMYVRGALTHDHLTMGTAPIEVLHYYYYYYYYFYYCSQVVIKLGYYANL